ncbi:glycosyltransferase [Salegentibacter salarius]|uniref:Glycosyl transferase family 2 n=1 Tax=Salegentibacter salarius TaxID=435906 RepID=A0A2N0TYR4_9FLAO|nr:glycosyltransferase [Salegentibacter salarius]OEY72901.1 glycosyl transferase family 2 [Salegentibacter salarius]PKD19798.1 glycosyl transferase family 2 [Salegentibacter salarius]SLJ86860.1 Glycosyl transferase family 2 [Salegentibacter salarius]
MKTYIIIPAYNEAEFIGETLQSLIGQSKPADKIVVVDDGSTDSTPEIVSEFIEKHPEISLIKNASKGKHLPGSKVVNAFNLGFKTLHDDFDIICKFDADLIFPKNYLEKISLHFDQNLKTGMVGGFCEIQKNGDWILENLTGKDHIRGALKAYRKACFKDIGGLKPAMGWDTVDELLAQYHGWEIKTDITLRVKHLKPTGNNYNKNSKYKQGAAFYRLRYGFVISVIASAKLAFKKKNLGFLWDCIIGFLRAKNEKRPFLVDQEEGRFIRNLRWKKMQQKLF